MNSPHELIANGRLLGYLDRWSVRPGESIVAHVSCQGGGFYDAKLVRIIQGDIHPDGPGYREEVISLELGGPFAACFQPLQTGSYAMIDDCEAFAALSSFGISLAIWPTTPGRGVQTLVARRDPVSGYGIELAIDDEGMLAATMSSANGQVYVRTDAALVARRWYRISMSYDADAGRLILIQQPTVNYPLVDDAAHVVVDAPQGLRQSDVHAPLTFAARVQSQHNERRHYNGRIDNPVLVSVPFTDTTTAASCPAEAIVAAWDFSIDIPSQRIVDTGGNGLDGRLFNLPTRGVSGIDWNGDCHAWPHDAAGYSAIHFHDDDLYDAGWNESFRVCIPEDLGSGVYALHLFTDDAEFYLPFCVRKAAATHGADVVFLLPTASYMAYANNRIGLDVPETELVCGRLLELHAGDLFMQTHPELGLSFYDLHSDGSGVYYSSRLRPVMDMQPKWVGKLGGAGSNVWQFNADTHILGWLETQELDYDVVTDEDLHCEGVDCLDGCRVLITGSHPEYYTKAMRDALDEFLAEGGRLMYLGGNGLYWRVSFHPQLPGVIECRKSEDGIRAVAPGPGEYYASFTGEYTGLWRRNGRTPNLLTGVGMVAQGFDVSSPYIRTAASHDARATFVFDGIEGEVIGDFGLSGGAAAGIELDAADVELGTPPHALVLASSHTHTDLYLMTPEDMLDPVPGLGGSEAQNIRADLVFFETPGGGAVFSTGSIAWAGSMAWNKYDNDVARLTENVLQRFIQRRPFNCADEARAKDPTR